jgi:hypothetical protein
MADLALHDRGALTKKLHQTNYECSLGFLSHKGFLRRRVANLRRSISALPKLEGK